MTVPLRHLSVRVPWHDSGWNGKICNDSRNNSACMFLPRIQNKDVDFEEENKGKWLHEIDDKFMPPCVDEKVAFLSPHDIVRIKTHPFSEFDKLYEDIAESPLKYPGWSFMIIPFNWMLKDKETKESEKAKSFMLNYDLEKEPKLSFKDQWVQHIDNQRALLDAFASAIVPDDSLIFIYAKNIPLIDRMDRVLIGATTVKRVGELVEYKYKTKNPPLRSSFWERPVYHGLNPKYEEGFILPYHELIASLTDESQEEIEQYIAYAPNFEEFSYGSELVTHDTAIDALISLRNALHTITERMGTKQSYQGQFAWINEKLSNLWNMRGAFPGLGPVLSAMQLPEGNIVAWNIETHLRQQDGEIPTTDPWDKVLEVLHGKADWLRKDLRVAISKSLAGAWDIMSEQRKEYLKLLSRLNINNEQAQYFYENHHESDYLSNMYLFYENSLLTHHPISIDVVDKAAYLKENLLKTFPLPKGAQTDGLHDHRRIRAFVINTLELAASQGHSLQTQEQVISSINERDKENPLSVTQDILNYTEKFFTDKISIELVQSEGGPGYKYYKLSRYADYKKIIFNTIHNRVHKARRINATIDWQDLLDKEIKTRENTSDLDRQKEARARKEKLATLEEISQSRFSIVIGPAGTGKTTLLNVFCSHPAISNPGILKLTPTGKARVKLGPDAKTIAQFLAQYQRYNGTTGRYYPNDKAQKYSEARTVIIDEASMLTEDQLAAVLDAVVDNDRLILVGDPRQLPPIGTGKPFVEISQYLKPELTIPGEPVVSKGYAELKEIFRQKKDVPEDNGNQQNRIDVRLSQWFSNSLVRKEEEDIFEEIVQHQSKNWESLKFVEWFNVNDLEEKLLLELKFELSLADTSDNLGFDASLGAIISKGYAYYNIGSGKKAENWQILSPVNTNGFGTKEINRLIQKTFRHKTLERAVNPPELSLGGGYVLNKVKRYPAPVGLDNMVYGDKVINLRNTRWDKQWQYIYNPPKNASIQPLKYFANGEIGLIVGEFRTNKFLTNHYKTPKDKRRKLYPPNVQIEFSSQPGYAYSLKESDFREEGDIEFELAYAITVHKSQGSGFKTTFLILPNPCRLLSRELLYTALTRQEERIIIFHQGDIKDFKKYTNDGFSETGRRLTDIFNTPALKEIKKHYYDSNYVQISALGEFMISKSEVIIADQLYYQRVPYTYEQPFTDGRGMTVHPDFTIENRELGVVFYWEHLGMLAHDGYRKKWEMKKEWYAHNGIVPYEQATQDHDKILITTRDKPDGGIDSQHVKEIIEKVIKAI